MNLFEKYELAWKIWTSLKNLNHNIYTTAVETWFNWASDCIDISELSVSFESPVMFSKSVANLFQFLGEF